MANIASKKRARKRPTTRRPTKVADMTRDELRDLLTEVIDARLEARHIAPQEAQGFDWLAAARQVRNRTPLSPDSTPLLRALREERASR